MRCLLKKVAWTSGSEFYGEFGLEMKKIKSEKWKEMSSETRAIFDLCAFARSEDLAEYWFVMNYIDKFVCIFVFEF